MQRRHFLGYLGAGSLSLTLPFSTLQAAATVPDNTGITGKIVVIGGGLAGATLAKYLRLWGGTNVEVTLIDSNATYQTCIHSSLVLTGQRKVTDLQFSYAALQKQYGVKFVHDHVMGIDTGNREVLLQSGSQFKYDRLVVAPGVDFDFPEGMTNDGQDVLHAWKGGPQLERLHKQITAMVPGDTFILSIPKMPYRCPPGPYERACLVADYLKKNKPACKVIVLDANPGITAGKKTFTRAFEEKYAGTLAYLADTSVESIDYNAKTITTTFGKIRGNVFNIIPPQRAGKIIADAGLNNVDQRWAGVDMMTYASTAAEHVYVIGDAAATTQPKAGHIANAEAKVCADAILSSLQGKQPNSNPRTTSACYTAVSQDSASWLTVLYKYDAKTKTMIPATPPGEGAEINTTHFADMSKWYDNLMNDTFS